MAITPINLLLYNEWITAQPFYFWGLTFTLHPATYQPTRTDTWPITEITGKGYEPKVLLRGEAPNGVDNLVYRIAHRTDPVIVYSDCDFEYRYVVIRDGGTSKVFQCIDMGQTVHAQGTHRLLFRLNPDIPNTFYFRQLTFINNTPLWGRTKLCSMQPTTGLWLYLCSPELVGKWNPKTMLYESDITTYITKKIRMTNIGVQGYQDGRLLITGPVSFDDATAPFQAFIFGIDAAHPILLSYQELPAPINPTGKRWVISFPQTGFFRQYTKCPGTF
jgi:hypothetical protein